MVLRMIWNVATGVVNRTLNRAKIHPNLLLQPSVWKARSGVLDCDLFLHLNNSSYFYAMELARWHLCTLTRYVDVIIKNRMVFLVASQAIRIRYPIAPFTAYEVHSHICYWDDSWAYFLQRFVCPKTGKIYADGLVRAAVTQGNRRVSMQEIMHKLGMQQVQPPKEMPPLVASFLEYDLQTKTIMEEAQKQRQSTRPQQPQQQRKAQAETPAKAPVNDPKTKQQSNTLDKLFKELRFSTNYPFEPYWLDHHHTTRPNDK